MDTMTGFWSQLLARTGLALNPEVALAAGLALTVIIVAVALALGRRGSRLQERLVDREILQPNLRSAEPPVGPPPGSDPDALAETGAAAQLSGESSRPRSEPDGDMARLISDLENMREGMASHLPSTKAEFMAVQESVQNYQGRIELLRTTLNSLQSEQVTLHKLLDACNTDLHDIEQFAASLPRLRTEHASIRKQLAELNARFEAVSEVLADFLPSEDPPNN
jgi:hypothetical protein